MLDRISDGVAGGIALAGLALAAYSTFIGGLQPYALASLVLALSMLVVGGWWLRRQAAGTPFHELAIPAAVATVMPLLVGGEAGVAVDSRANVAAWILAASAAGTLGLRLADALPERLRMRMSLASGLLALGAAAIGILGPGISWERYELSATLAVLLMAAATALPGLVAGVARHASRSGAPREAVLEALELGVVGVTPAIAVVTTWGQGGSPLTALPLVIWILAVLAAQYLAVRPLLHTATVATTQRDQVVAAMEAERSRIAADIHDDALQELTLLGWRLDASGDAQGAATAREISDRLRGILGDLRLPILDDLGCGPALEWLVERVGRLAGGEVRLERSDTTRPPAEVELAFFRVAQEALSNAVRHGRPPIVVRYWASPSGASLSVDDAGAGIDPRQAGDGATQQAAAGHFGLLNMRQRAEGIGALLEVRPWPQGGTRVTLEWRA